MSEVIKAKLPTRYGEFEIRLFPEGDKEHVALCLGDIGSDEPVLLRVHSECLTGDTLFSLRCDCGFQLQSALQKIAEAGRGVLLYLRQEGRGIGLTNKIRAYHLQDHGQDTVEANVSLGFGPDQREYAIAISMLQQLAISKVRLMTNNPRKVNALSDAGITVVERVALASGANPHNQHYLKVKQHKLGHLF